MSEQPRPTGSDDVAGHLSPRPSDIHDAVADDVAGRRFPSGTAGPQRGSDDAAGHAEERGHADEDDVAGHGLGPLDPKRT
jgi:hypothetical protein